MRTCFVFLALAFFSIKALAQTPDTVTVKNTKDSLTRAQDSVKSKPFVPKARTSKVFIPDSTHSPHKAFVRSATIPGWGQLYNHRWWKVPIIYGGLGTLAGIGIWNQQQYKIFLKEANARRNGTVSTGPYRNYQGTADDFFTYAASYQRNFQLCILGFVGFWGINCIDAYIDAKFIHSYSIDNNLSFKITPTIINQSQPVYAFNAGSYIPAVKLTLAF